MPAYIHKLETSLPQFKYQQDELREQMKQLVADSDLNRRVIHQVYSRSGIESRYSILEDFKQTPLHQKSLFFNGHGDSPATGYRNDVYIREGRKLFVETARKLCENSETKPIDITHLITVSCTGFYAPGPDYDIIKSLGMKSGTERYHLGFMGCYAVLPALKLAAKITENDPDANVMVISAELCTLHFQAGNKTDHLISASVFGDGAAGAIVKAHKPENNGFQLNRFASTITKKGSEDMAWSIGDNGFDMVLSAYIPELLTGGLDDFLEPVLKHYDLDSANVSRWAVHPGGRAILDKVESYLNLPVKSLESSRYVLSKFGNMSSATILFVLDHILRKKNDPANENEQVIAMAFGPGLTIESAHLTKL